MTIPISVLMNESRQYMPEPASSEIEQRTMATSKNISAKS